MEDEDDDDDAPVEKSKPAPIIVKKSPAPLSDSDDDGLFNDTKKKETPRTSTVEEKTETTNENQTGRKSIKDLAVNRKIESYFRHFVHSFFSVWPKIPSNDGWTSF